jgi:hypothetical protein
MLRDERTTSFRRSVESRDRPVLRSTGIAPKASETSPAMRRLRKK